MIKVEILPETVNYIQITNNFGGYTKEDIEMSNVIVSECLVMMSK